MDNYKFLLKNNRYKIIRMFKDENISNKTIKTGLTLKQAQKHCNDVETSSSTCKEPVSVRITDKFGHWFDGYTTY